MWKKYQTYLISTATMLCVSMFFCRLATIIGPGGEELDIMYYEKLPFAVMLIMLLAAGVSAVFCHKFPLLQARVCMISALMQIGFQIWLSIDFFKYHNEMVFSVTMVFPLIACILNVMAAHKALVDGMTLTAVKSLKKSKRLTKFAR